VLGSTYSLHDVEDVEEFCGHIARLFYSRTEIRLTHSEHDDLVAYLIAECWKLSERYNPTSPYARFRSYAHSLLSRRCIDWMRSHRGRSRWQWKDHSYERKRPQLISLDAVVSYDDHARTLGEFVADRTGDPAAGGDSDLAWLFAQGNRERNRDFRVLRKEFAARTRQRAAVKNAEQRQVA
jgi:RNA polymerase sigma factor (sigma-70 family)